MSVRLCAFVFVSCLLVATRTQAVVVDCVYDANAEWPWSTERTCQIRESTVQVTRFANDATTSNAAICSSALVDSDGDGWGWENERSCRVTATAASGNPVCSSSHSDTDGDGWGWENERSCRVSGTAASSNPVCSSASSDADGDGWGWENDQSCIVSTDQSTDDTYPSCSSASADPDGDGWGYENNVSCRVVESTEFPICSSASVDEDGDGWGYENNASCKYVTDNTDDTDDTIEEEPDFKIDPVVFQQNFNSSQAGQYTRNQLNTDWNTPIWHLGFDQGRAHILPEDGRGNTLRITYPANQYGASGASAFLSDLEFALDLPQSYEELYVSYDVKFAAGFDFVRGGKLPGLCGYDNSKSPAAGCNTGGGYPNGFDGWSARGMWRENGVLENYVYHSSQNNFYGDDEYWNENAIPGQWHTIQHRVVMNTIGKADGILEAWIDGRKVLEENTFVYRKTEQIGINLFYFSTFFGGNDPTWAPSADQYAYFDNFRIATSPLPLTQQAREPVLQQAVEPVLNDATTEGGANKTGLSTGGGSTTIFIALLCLLRRRCRAR